MIGMLVALMLLSWIFGRTRGLIGGLAGGFVGALVVAGMTAATSNGELAALYSPGRLAWVAVPAAVVAAVLALVAPYAIGQVKAGGRYLMVPRWLRSSEHQGWPLVVASGALSRCSRRR
jgi:protein involved in polysaccharide export with SLBB domain